MFQANLAKHIQNPLLLSALEVTSIELGADQYLLGVVFKYL